ncbi:MAG: hypothetical protein HUJ72_12025 [Blautia sp.]|nr:hypothetical protein [Blautia sp.]
MKSMGIDVGTTTISAVVMDTQDKKVLESKTVPNNSFITTGQDWERIQDVSVVIAQAFQVIDELLARHADIGSIGLTGQMHGIVYTDEKGLDVSPLYTWQDGRGNLAGDKDSVVDEIRKRCNLTVASGYGVVTHIYNQKNGLVPEKAVSFCTIGDYLGMRLCSRTRPLIHISNAASLGFFDGKNARFDSGKTELMNVNQDMLPEVTADFDRLGEYKGIPVTVALGDNQASFLGSVGLQENVLLLNMGTGGQISVLSDEYFEAPGIEARPIVRDRFILVGSSLCGGRAYAILERFLRAYAIAAGAPDQCQYGIMEELALKGAGKEDAMSVETTFQGTRADPSLRGAVTNLSAENFTPEGLIYGVLKGMSAEFYRMYEVIRKGTGIQAEHIVASGNGYRMNKMLQQISAEMFRAELTLAPYQEEAACGAAISSMENIT